MKRSFILVCLLAIAVLTMAEPYRMAQRGYRGFVDVGAAFSFNRIPSLDLTNGQYMNNHDRFLLLSTTHGYQFNDNLFLGAGVLFGLGEEFEMPIYVDGRYDFKFNKFTPFADLRIGYNIGKERNSSGFWFSPTIGYRFNWGRKLGLNLGIGFSFKDMVTDKIKTVLGGPDYPWYEPDEGVYDPNKEYVVWDGSRRRLESYWTFRVGIDF